MFKTSICKLAKIWISVSVLVLLSVSVFTKTKESGSVKQLTDEGHRIGKKQSITDMVHFSDKDPFPWSDLTHFNYSNLTVPPPVTNYTYFSLETCLYGYWILIVIQACLIMLAKKVTNPEVYQRQDWSKRITHALENTLIPMPMEDWDDQHGPIHSYVKAQKQVEKEMGVILFIKLFFQFLMGIPIMILGKKLF